MTGEGGFKKYKNDVYWGEIMSSVRESHIEITTDQEAKNIIIPNGNLFFAVGGNPATIFSYLGSKGLKGFLENITPKTPNEQFQNNKAGILKDPSSREELSWLYYNMVWYVQTLCRNLILQTPQRQKFRISQQMIREVCDFVCECMNADLVSFLSNQSCTSIADLNKFFIGRWSDYELMANSVIATTILTALSGSDASLDYGRQDHRYEPKSLEVISCESKNLKVISNVDIKVLFERELKARLTLTQPNVKVSMSVYTWQDRNVEEGLCKTVDIFNACQEKIRSFDKVSNLEKKEDYISACIASLEAYQYKFKFFGIGFWRRQHYTEAKTAITSLKGLGEDNGQGIERAKEILSTFKQQIMLKKNYTPAGHSLVIHGLYAKGAVFLNSKQQSIPESKSRSPTLSK